MGKKLKKVWSVLRWPVGILSAFLTWTGWSGPEFLERLAQVRWLGFINSDNFRSGLVVVGLAGIATAVLVRGVRSDRAKPTAVTPRSSDITPAAPTKRSLPEMLRLGDQFTKTSQAIYAFLNKQAMRSDEPQVVAEYRQKFDAKVLNLCLELISAGFSDSERLKKAMKPPTSVDDIQWIARVLAVNGEGWGRGLLQTAQEVGVGSLVKTRRTNKGRFPRIESASDSFGNQPDEEVADGLVVADTGKQLTVGDEVRFELKLSDPKGEDALVGIFPPGGSDAANMAVAADGVVTWTVRDKDVSDRAHVFIFVQSTRALHRMHSGIDDEVAFVYKVVPRSGKPALQGAH